MKKIDLLELKIQLHHLTEGKHALEVSSQKKPKTLEIFQQHNGLNFVRSFESQGTLTCLEPNYIVQLDNQFLLSLNCSRCASDFQKKYSHTYDGLYFYSQRKKNTIDEEDSETTQLQEPIINLEKIFVESLNLATPYQPLCQDQCKGYCTTCKMNLNENNCQCSTESVTNSPFDKLKNYLK